MAWNPLRKPNVNWKFEATSPISLHVSKPVKTTVIQCMTRNMRNLFELIREKRGSEWHILKIISGVKPLHGITVYLPHSLLAIWTPRYSYQMWTPTIPGPSYMQCLVLQIYMYALCYELLSHIHTSVHRMSTPKAVSTQSNVNDSYLPLFILKCYIFVISNSIIVEF